MIELVGATPGLIIVGAVIDLSCVLWEEDCGEKGSCWLYDNAWLSYYLTILIVSVEIIKLLFAILALILYKPQEKALEMNLQSVG